MKTHPSLANITKVYTPVDQKNQWANTTVVRHGGIVIAFAQSTDGHFYYAVLNLNNSENADKFMDVDFWDEQPQSLDFPVEVVMAGMEAASLHEMPVLRQNGSRAEAAEYVAIPERHPYKSTTACLSEAAAPFRVHSDGSYIYLFRQAGAYKSDGLELSPSILMDRFVFDGSGLKRKLEQRYQRSRNKSIPQSRKDTLGYEDLNNTPFYEPTHILETLLGKVKHGNFAVTLVPSMLPDEQNWQFFIFDDESFQIKGINLTRSDDSLFDERGTVFYKSSDQKKYPEIFTTTPGQDPDGKPLIPWKETEKDTVGGKQTFAVPLPGNNPVCHGLDVVIYARLGMSRAMRGYDSDPKPVLRQQRVLLAVNVQGSGEPKPRLVIFDFGISNDGRLANAGSDSGVNLGPLSDERQTGNRTAFEQIAPLQEERDFLQIEPEIAQIKDNMAAVEKDFDALFSGLKVVLYWSEYGDDGKNSSESRTISYNSTKSISITNFDAASLEQPTYFNVPGDKWEDEADAVEFHDNCDLELTLHDHGKETSQVLSASSKQSELRAFSEFGWGDRAKWIILKPNEALKQKMVQLHAEYGMLGTRLNEKLKLKLDLPAELQDLSAHDLASKIEELDEKINALVQQGHWDIRLAMPNINLDIHRNLTLDGGILDFAGSEYPPQLARNSDGSVSLFYRGAADEAFLLHYDGFDRGLGASYPVPEAVKKLSGNRSLEALFMLPKEIGVDAQTSFIFGGIDTTKPGGDYGVYVDHKKDWLITYVNKRVLAIPLSDPNNKRLFDRDQLIHLVIVSNSTKGNKAYINGKLAVIASHEIVIIWGMPTEFRLYQVQDNPDLLPFAGEIYGIWIWPSAVPEDDVAKLYDGAETVNGKKAIFSTKTGRMHWVGSTPGLAVAKTKDGILASEDKAARFASQDQMTAELWISPLIKGRTNILSHPDFAVQLTSKDETSPISVLYSFHGKKGSFSRTLTALEWSHLAFVYQAAYGLQFDGDDFVKCGDNQTLNIVDDLTIEVALQVENPNDEQTIIFKGSVGEKYEEIAYELLIRDKKLIWRCSEDLGDNIIKNWEIGDTGINFKGNKPTRIAVTREYFTDTKGLTDALGADGEKTVDPSQYTYYLYSFHQDGKLKKSYKLSHGEPRGSNGEFVIGARHQNASFFRGVISEVRVWNVKRDKDKIHAHISPSASGLVSWWRINENKGFVIEDAKTLNPGSVVGARWVRNLDPEAAFLQAYVNGVRMGLVDNPKLELPPEGFKSFGIGTRTSESEPYHGMAEEIRLWSVARTEEQIQDNLFRRLDSEHKLLLAYYDCDVEGTQLLDRSGHDLHLEIQADQLEYSSAPIGTDLPIVRNALANIPTQFNSPTTSAPASAEYGDIQTDRKGNDFGVLKRTYSIIHEGQWELLTGFKIGDLEMEWIGQAQFAPQVIGFVEGAPPVPSENLTMDDDDNYADAVSVEMTEAKSTMYAIGSSRERTTFTTANLTAMAGINTETSVGIGAQTKAAEVQAGIGVAGSIEFNSSWVDESQVGFGKNLTKSSQMILTGTWESNDAIKHPGFGQRFLPRNYGYALVQSETVDIFALRLKRSGIMVSKAMRKNPDIPQDWNIIMFPINKQYVKQGSLDGFVGHEPDEDYPNNRGSASERSYYKPKEAYQIKQSIERQEQIARDIYQRAMSTPGNHNVSKRDIANTYVWTADGGLFAETTETVDTVEEVSAGTYSVTMAAGVVAEWDVTVGSARTAGNLEVMVGGSTSTTVSKSVGVEEGFGLEVNVEIDRDIFERDNNDHVVLDLFGNPKKLPGKVDAYRFMTFYLSPNNRHLKELSNKVIDPQWLKGNDPHASAMRQALQNDKSIPWRILHRVTFISRVHSSDDSTADEGTDEQHQMSDRTIASNYDIIRYLEPRISPPDRVSYTKFSAAVRKAVQDSPNLKKYAEDADKIVKVMSEYLGIYPTDA